MAWLLLIEEPVVHLAFNYLVNRIFKYIFYTLLGLTASLLIFVYLVFNNNAFQNWLTGKVTDYLSAQFKTNISIGRIKYNPFSSFTLQQVYFGDQKNDTLFYAGSIKFNLGRIKTDSAFFGLRNVQVDSGLCKIVTYPDSTFNINVLFNIIDRNDTIPDSTALPFHLFFDRVTCTNTRFQLIDSTAEFSKEGFDGLNEYFYNIALKAEDFHIIADSLNLKIAHISCLERSGLVLNDLSCNAIISPKGMFFDSLALITPRSYIRNYFSMQYKDWDAVTDFNNNVVMKAHLATSHIDMQDIAFFAPMLKEYKQRFVVDADCRGTVSNLRLKNLELHYGHSVLEGRVNLSGLPNINETYIDAQVEHALTTSNDIEYLTGVSMPKELQHLGQMQFQGAYTGFYEDFVAYGTFRTALGNIHSDLNMKLGDNKVKPSYSGKLELIRFNLGKLFGIENYLGTTSLETTVKGTGFAFKDLHTTFDTKVKYLEANNYSYSNIAFSGKLENKMFNGTLNVKDPNAQLTFGGIIDYNKDIPLYKFKSTLKYIDLKKLNFDTANLILSANVDIDFALKDLDENEGKLVVSDITFLKDGQDYQVDEITLESRMEGDKRNIRVFSDDFDASIKGNVNLQYIGDALHNINASLFPDYFAAKPISMNIVQDFTFNCNIIESDVFSDLFFPSLYLTDVKIRGYINDKKNEGEVHVTAESVEYKDFAFSGISLNTNTTNGEAGHFTLNIERLKENDTSILRNISLESNAERNKLETRILIRDSAEHIHSNVAANTIFSKDKIVVTFDSSIVSFRSIPFTITEDGNITYDKKQITFSDVQLHDGPQFIALNGFYDLEGDHNLRADLNGIDLSHINTIYRKSSIQYGGVADGALVLKGSNHTSFINTFLNINKLSLDGDTIGDFSVNSNFNEKQQQFMIYAKSVSGKLKNLELGGYIETNKKPAGVNFNIAFDESPLNSFQAFLKDNLHIYEGNASAKCKITGNLQDLNLTGNIAVNDVKARVEYLKTVYRFSTTLNFNENEIKLEPTTLKDEKGNTGTLYGSVYHRSFSNFRFDLGLRDLKKFQLLNTTFKDNSLYYGTGYASGNMTLTGPILDLVLDAHIRTEAGTQFFIPLTSEDGSADNGVINFVNKDTNLLTINTQKDVRLYGFSMNIFLDVTPSAEIQMIFDPVNNDNIRGKGKGLLKMELTKQGAFSMYGNVEIEEGDYKITAISVFTRKFTIKKGSTISWSGDPFAALLNIEGVYKVRNTSVADILTSGTEKDLEQARQQRVPVECLLHIKGNLLNPDIKFDINFPDLNSLGTNNVAPLENSLRTMRNDPDLMNQEVVSLLLFGRFVPINGQQFASGTNLNSGINNTVSDLISSQANNLISKVLPGFDFNVDIQTATADQKMRTILSASKRWNRFELQASYDMLTYNNNVMSQYYLTKDGNLRVRAYNKTVNNIDNTYGATVSTPGSSYNRNVNTQGIGLYYRKEFDTFIELFKKNNKKL